MIYKTKGVDKKMSKNSISKISKCVVFIEDTLEVEIKKEVEFFDGSIEFGFLPKKHEHTQLISRILGEKLTDVSENGDKVWVKVFV